MMDSLRRSARAVAGRPAEQMRLHEFARDGACTIDMHGPVPPASLLCQHEFLHGLHEIAPAVAGSGRGRDAGRARSGLGWSAIASRTRCANAGPTPGNNCSTRNPATRSREFSTKRSTASKSLTCAVSRNFNPPNFTNGMLRRVSSSSTEVLWCEARNRTACCLRFIPSSRFASTHSAM